MSYIWWICQTETQKEAFDFERNSGRTQLGLPDGQWIAFCHFGPKAEGGKAIKVRTYGSKLTQTKTKMMDVFKAQFGNNDGTRIGANQRTS